jgi:flagellar motor switch protein FliN/FliY
MSPEEREVIPGAGFQEELSPAPRSAAHLRLKDIYGVKLEMSADLGRCTMLVREVLELKRGSVLPLDKLAGEMTDIHINGIPFGRGEVVVLADTLHVRISEIHNPRGQYDK